MSRYRLRFLLQEVDLRSGDTIVGRSSSCHITIEDPLVSRQHARFRVTGDVATVEDLGSRNGLVINGRPMRGVVELQDNDRVRVGTQELVFCVAPDADARPGTRSTGFMCHCGSCGHPYPTDLTICPTCGSDRRADDDTLSGVGDDAARNWTLDLLVEVIDRALGLERWDDAERVLTRAKFNIEERLASGASVDRPQLDRVAMAAARLAEHRVDAQWARWVLNLHAALDLVPVSDVGERLTQLPPEERASLAPAAERVAERVMARGGPPPHEVEAYARLESLRARG